MVDDLTTELELMSAESIEQILNSLISIDTNVQLKTRIKNPYAQAQVIVFAKILDDSGYDKEAEYLRLLLEELNKNNISLNGKSRDEVVKCISAIVRQKGEATRFTKLLDQNEDL